MKKFLFICASCLVAFSAMAGNGEGNCGVYMLVNDESQNYRLTDTDWVNNGITAALNGRPELKDANWGTVTSLTLCGGMMAAWANGNDYYEANSFRVAYRVYKQGETAPEEWILMPLDKQTYREGNDYRFEAQDKTIDIIALTDSTAGTWVFEAKMLGHKYWNDGSDSGSWDTDHNPQSAAFVLEAQEEPHTPTALDNVSLKNNGKYYDILGREVANPQPGNLYIHNGKKILY